ncbi:GGDEF domain-containing protein [Sulfurimonas sp. SAG-AH-194-C21]|nr:GGDEF domain-containing protein [Sulfurimonas sp. SAG-AH-194-C21]MDF1883338.1 GGDEF domain-containing protein [Sulfurimonas sp. SAG-AH-194-C21]
MKHSIKKIFLNLNTYLFFVLLVSFVAMMLTLEQQLSFEKVNNLNKQKVIISSLTTLKKDDIELALIQFNGKSTQLHQEIDKLKSIYKYDYSDKYIFSNAQEYLSDLDKLSTLTTAFNNTAHSFYVADKDEVTHLKTEKQLTTAFANITNHINHMLIKNIAYSQKKFNIIKVATIVLFVLILLATIWYRKKLFSIYKDIEFLYQIDKSKMNHDIYTLEVDAISMRMNRKTVTTDNPTMMDPVTGINNNKGLLNSYSNKKNLKDSNFTSVTIIEIDNFSKSKRAFSQEMTQNILKKIAYTISLHEQAIDVIARTDYNQFTLIFSRSSKEQSFKDVELIRQSIEELKFNITDKGPVIITVSGGFIIKPNNTNLDEASREAKKILQYAKSTGTNRILQTRDMAERHM